MTLEMVGGEAIYQSFHNVANPELLEFYDIYQIYTILTGDYKTSDAYCYVCVCNRTFAIA